MRTLGRALGALAMLSPAAGAAVYRLEVCEDSVTPATRDLASLASVVSSVPVTCVYVATDDPASAQAMAAQFALTPEHCPSSAHRACWAGWLPTGPDEEPVSLRVEGYGLAERVA